MKDYSNYKTKINMMEWSANKLFNVQLEGYEGKNGTIDSTSSQFLVQQSTNPLTESKEERTLLCLQSTVIHRGSLVSYTEDSETNNWIVISDIDFNGIYKSTKIHKCNNVITFLDSAGKIRTCPIILSNQTLYSDGISEEKQIITMDDMRSILVPYNADTKNFFVQQRFIFNHNSVYSISMIDDYTYFTIKDGSTTDNGILKLTMKREEFVAEDDKANNLAYNGTSGTQPVPTGTGYTFEVIGSDTIQEDYTETYTIKVYKDGVEEPSSANHTCIWSLIDPNNYALLIGETVSNTIQVKGLTSVNHVTLHAVLSIDNSITVDKDIIIVGTW